MAKRAKNPRNVRFGKGGAEWLQNIQDIGPIPEHLNWVNNYNMFRSPSGSVDIKTVREEYKDALDAWLRGGGDDLEEFRNLHGIIIDENGGELLTSGWKGERVRFKHEKQQTHSGKGMKSEAKQVPKEPWWAWETDENGNTILNRKGKKIKAVKLEGHHVVGLSHLGPFFEGATDKQAFELRQRILNETRRGAVGTDKRNWAWLTDQQHDLAHKLYGSATEADLVDPRNKGLVFTDIELPGKKGQSSLGQTLFPRSAEIRQRIADAPFDRPQWQTDRLKAGVPAKNIEGLQLTKGDYLISYLNMTDEAYEGAIQQAREARPHLIDTQVPSKENARVLGQSIFNINPGKSKGSTVMDSLNLKGAKVASKVGRADQVVNLTANVVGGNALGAGIAGGGLVLSEALKSKASQKAIAKQVSKLVKNRAAKTALKAVPGLDVLISGKEAVDYLAEGKFDQAGIAALSGAIGWVPVIGDGAAAALDFSNTGIDLARGVYNPQDRKKKQKLNTINQADSVVPPNRSILKTVKRAL